MSGMVMLNQLVPLKFYHTEDMCARTLWVPQHVALTPGFISACYRTSPKDHTWLKLVGSPPHITYPTDAADSL